MQPTQSLTEPNSENLPFIVKSVIGILRSNWRFGSLRIVTPSGHQSHIQGKDIGPEAVLALHNYKCLSRVLFSGDIGFFEGYRDGEWDTPDLHALLEVLSHNLDGIKVLQDGGMVMNIIHAIQHALKPNTRKGAEKNIFAHYDIGNQFYAQWLDKSMTYSAALFDRTHDLDDAQSRKYEEVARLVDLKAGQEVLEIGCGWGGFAQYAARLGAKVTCVTISNAQYDFTQALIKQNGLQDRVQVLLKDYRDIEGSYDCIVSIEMFEAVGEAYWGTYFDKMRALLKPGGKAGLQIITIRDDLFDAYRARTDFIQKYIFPGGMLPSIAKLKSQALRVQLGFQTVRQFGIDYATTLRHWTKRFEHAWQEGRFQGLDKSFQRLWVFYLAYCAAGFQSQRTDVVHLRLEKPLHV